MFIKEDVDIDHQPWDFGRPILRRTWLVFRSSFFVENQPQMEWVKTCQNQRNLSLGGWASWRKALFSGDRSDKSTLSSKNPEKQLTSISRCSMYGTFTYTFNPKYITNFSSSIFQHHCSTMVRIFWIQNLVQFPGNCSRDHPPKQRHATTWAEPTHRAWASCSHRESDRWPWRCWSSRSSDSLWSCPRRQLHQGFGCIFGCGRKQRWWYFNI